MAENIVYFLGAGASKNFGYPLTGEIMPEILNRLIDKTLFTDQNKHTTIDKDQEAELLEFIYKLYPGLRNADIKKTSTQIPNVTEILSLVDHFCLYNIPPYPDLTQEKLLYFRQLLNRAVGELLLHYYLKTYGTHESELLSRLIKLINDDKSESVVTVITTNYDLIIDKYFSQEILDNKIDFGIPYRNGQSAIVLQPATPLFKYYKLHGSLNWLICDLCGQYYINPFGITIQHSYVMKPSNSNTCICSDVLRLKSVLVAPSFVRDIRDANLLQIWKSAIEAIRTADKIVMIGYSLPGEDLGIKSIFMRGLGGRNPNRALKIDVVQYGNKAKQNYKNLFGDKIKYYKNGLADYLDKNS
jgi:NAD-dependent SIR2 family protein deacetylase